MSLRSPVRGGTPKPLVAEEVTRRFGPHVVLRDLDLRLEWGEAAALVGSNGAGKTTLLRILAGSLTPQKGRVRVAGAAAGSNAAREAVVLLSGDAYVYEDLTAAENLRFALEMTGRRASPHEIAGALERVGLERVPDRRARFFSSGMRKRLALARAFVLEPRVLLLDEPYASLDADASRLVDEIIAEWRVPGRALLMATHRRGRAGRTCDRLLRLDGGRIVEDASRTGPLRLEPRLLEAVP